MNDKNERILEAFSDEAFVELLLAAENEEAVQKLLADRGISMSLEEISEIGDKLGMLADGKIPSDVRELLLSSGELSEDELEQVAGGEWYDCFFKIEEHFLKNGVEPATENGRLAAEFAAKRGRAGYTWVKQYADLSPLGFGAAAVTVVAVAGIGIGIMEAVRRRW